MKHTSPLLLLAALSAAACNEKQAAPAITAETEPNNSYATANFLGSLGSSSSIEITGNIEDDDETNDDLVDHFLILPGYSGQVTITLTPDEPLANVLFVEELSASTDGQSVNAAGAGQAESAQLTVVSGQGLHIRVETTVAATDYSLNFSSPAPLSAEQQGVPVELHLWRVDDTTGTLQHSRTPGQLVLEPSPSTNP
jgi:hypothetical protein